MFDNDVVYFDNIKSRAVKLVEGKKTLATVSFEGFETLGLWTPAGKRAGFLCIEPWCSSDDYDDDSGIFEEKKGIQILHAKEFAKYKMTISAK
jgi:galactose mutarotase-like enzyme